MASLRVQPVPGWTATLTTAELDEPIQSHGQELTSYVSVVEFRADDGGGIGPGEFQEFALSGGPFPETEKLAFPTVQTYSDGSESAWIEPTVDGAEPEHPAPVLVLASSAPAPSTAAPSEAAAAEPAAHDVPDSSPGALALFVAILALLVAVAAAVLGWRANRRTVSS